MQYETILYEVINQVAYITLNIPEKNNPLTTRSTKELIDAVKKADGDAAVHVIVLTGAGKSFCAGGDLKEFSQNLEKTAPKLYKEGHESTELFKLPLQIRTPIIGAINGAALGGGTGITAMCHLAIASDRASFGLTELKLGLVPFVILPWVKKVVGSRKMMELMLTADTFTAEQALKYGLVHRVVSHAELQSEVEKLAQKIAAHSPLAVELALESFYKAEQMDFSTSLDFLTNLRMVSFQSEDLKEGATAFLEKRQPVWQGK